MPEAMADLVLHLMAKEPDERVQTAGEVAGRLQEISNALRS